MPNEDIEGKTKIIQEIEDPNLVRIVTKNVLTANDAEIKASIDGIAGDKTAQTCNIFKLLKKHNIPTAYQSRNDDTSFIAKKCRMIPIECVIRRRPYGSYFKRHPDAVVDQTFDPLLLEFYHKHAVVVPRIQRRVPRYKTILQIQHLPENEIKWSDTNTTDSPDPSFSSADIFTDPLIEFDQNPEAIATGVWHLYPAKQHRKVDQKPLFSIVPVVGDEEIYFIKNSLMIPTFEVIENAWKKFNVTLVDMKIEVGYTRDGELVVADVIDNDSWRIWPNGDPKQQLDKQAFRDAPSKLSIVEENYKTVTQYTNKF
jgi:phosphoribosylaminoimidazole-succinocarboxamide synthase